MWTPKMKYGSKYLISTKKLIYFHCLRLLKTAHLGTNTELPANKWTSPKGYDTGIQIYNTILKNKVPLILNKEKCVSWYGCGPTVYDSSHLGHASCYVTLDIIRRILQNYFDINVFYMMGITDIDDKIIASSIQKKEDFYHLARRFESEFFDEMISLNVLMPTVTSRVTEHIPVIINFIEKIISNGFGYKATDGSVYFKVENFKGYGKLNPPKISNMSEAQHLKMSQQDFALWKSSKPEEPSWDSPWGKGRPGWHIECSAMASKVLGTNFDIHSGGIDLIFPHHENEEAQSCAHHGVQQWVNYWLHTGHLFVKGDVKMSKSLKNTISIQEFLKTYTANHFRMLCMISPYRSGIEFSEETMNNAVGNYRKIESFISDCNLYVTGVKKDGCVNESEVFARVNEAKKTVISALQNDFDTPRVVNTIMNLISSVNIMLQKPSEEGASKSPVAIAAASGFVKHSLEKLGLQFSSSKSNKESMRMKKVLDLAVQFRSIVREIALNKEMVKAVPEQRKQLLQSCDSLRDNLFKAGVELKDHGQGTTSWNLAELAKHKSGK